ncbi:MAG: SDR family NAD(P)-dependent oxidoreductase [Paracoccus sp. (in: a-proteobacteria)]|nr:SDR family NAD(P)-dependent oxidoreductase [Paracoccus sp. (in: a-proteobacteria)]
MTMGAMHGRRVLVTGGGSGTGADLARGFAEAGAGVVICGRRPEPLAEVAARHHAIRAIACDITDEASVSDLFRQAGPVDIVIANAGQSTSAPFVKTSLEDWQRMASVNLTGTFLTFREGLRQMTGWGRLIAVASTAGLKGYARTAPYAAAKHGVIGLVRSLALEVAAQPVTVNALCPGFLDTEMTAATIRNISEKTGRSAGDARAALEAFSPQKRLIRPDEVTAAALWLCAPGSEGINGQPIAIAGGEI